MARVVYSDCWEGVLVWWGEGEGGERTVQQPRSTRWCQGAEGGAGVEERVAAMAVRRVAGSSVSWGGGSAWGFGGWGVGEGETDLDVEEEPDGGESGLGDVLEEVGEAGKGLVGSLRGAEGAEVGPVAVGDLFVDAKGAFQGGVLGDVNIVGGKG